MNIRHLTNLLFRRKHFEKPSRITKDNVKGFLQGNLRSFTSKLGFLSPDPHIEEQAFWRISLIKEHSPICITEGQCKVCGCSTDEIVFEDRPCKGGCYPAMMNLISWTEFKNKNKVNIL